MFEKASRLKLRFEYKGNSTTEDLWDIPLTELDTMFGELRKLQQATDGESLLKEKKGLTDILLLKISIIKHVVLTRLQELQTRKDEFDKKARKKRLLHIIADKQDASLQEKSIEELTKLVEDL
jgi:hypothetical protein